MTPPHLATSASSAPADPEASTNASSAAVSSFERDLAAGLSAIPRHVSPKYFYDAAGSTLFEQICELPEYYPTRTEMRLLADHAADIAALAGPRAEIVEFGAGALQKIRLLLDAFDTPAGYLPIDISGDHLNAAAATLKRDYPALSIQPVVADYTQRLLLPAPATGSGRRVGFFPGSTIGNFTPAEALRFLQLAAQVLRGGALLLGADLVKDPATLHAAYNDAQGVTADFNLNLLARANRELGADFDLSQFAHHAFYNVPMKRIEMHLVSKRDQQVRLAGEVFDLPEGESIHTENSHKFTIAGLRELAARAGFTAGPAWTDADGLFSLHWLQAPA
ncbi:L-histidine N(alpha)-methyltransferase [Xylophilus sp. Kf1]|nr:L-histidine N(alpha)-methyltransferase [Xylophilus sp. Kf1]